MRKTIILFKASAFDELIYGETDNVGYYDELPRSSFF